MRGAPWLGWITDLSAKDPYFVMPLIMGVTMVVQTKLNPTPPDPMQAKIMHWMPIIFTGMFLGLVSPVLAFWLYTSLSYPEIGMWEVFAVFQRRNVHTHVISLAVLVNLIVFFIALWTQKEKLARGVLGMTILYAILVFILKFT
jgi:hypothetical protein